MPRALDISDVYETPGRLLLIHEGSHGDIDSGERVVAAKALFSTGKYSSLLRIYAHLKFYCRSKRGDTSFCPRFKSSFIPAQWLCRCLKYDRSGCRLESARGRSGLQARNKGCSGVNPSGIWERNPQRRASVSVWIPISAFRKHRDAF